MDSLPPATQTGPATQFDPATQSYGVASGRVKSAYSKYISTLAATVRSRFITTRGDLLEPPTFCGPVCDLSGCSESCAALTNGMNNNRFSGLYTRLTEAVRLHQAA